VDVADVKVTAVPFPPVIEGIVAEIRWTYYTAAAINGYRLTWERAARRWSLAATVVLADAFKIAQRPLVFVALVRGAEWQFDILSFELPGLHGPMTARLGLPRTHRK
jgi:hypothetical protein